MDYLIQSGLSNTFFAAILAMIAAIVGFRFRHPQLAYWLWLLVFVKLVTPPLINIPLPDLAHLEFQVGELEQLRDLTGIKYFLLMVRNR